ncbi:hypothetical protein CF65_01384 [Aggregatibacter actinomycetemcomitans HK1651]|nr:hypothetical protein CF65_01384 [Aggregatibacter actinomycetemcomitans HK1651]
MPRKVRSFYSAFLILISPPIFLSIFLLNYDPDHKFHLYFFSFFFLCL